MTELWQITSLSPPYCAGLVIKDGICIAGAPIVSWAIGWKRVRLLAYFAKRRHRVHIYHERADA